MRSHAKQGFTLVEIMIVVAIIALLAAIAIPNLLRAKISANDALAKGTLRALFTGSESFATSNGGQYPNAISELTNANPPYLSSDYCDKNHSGYYYSCSFDRKGYVFTATPVEVGTSGTTTWTISTGGVMNPREK